MGTKKFSHLAKFEIRDRNLGDEWLLPDWSMEEASKNITSGRRLFIGFAFLSIILLAGFTWFALYMIEPRLRSMHPVLPYVAGIAALAFAVLLLLGFGLTVFSIMCEKNFLLHIFGREFSLSFLAPMVLKLGERFGISRDKMSHSFIKVSNSLIKATQDTFECEKLLILIPRCLQRPIRDKISELAEKYHCEVYTASGGEAARKVVAQSKPSAIIGVACERDLLSGLQDNLDKIPIIAIPNIRPEGPCKNTLVELDEIEKAVKFFLHAPAE